MKEIAVLGVPTNSAGTTDGVARAPAALREVGLVEHLARVVPTSDEGDVTVPPPTSDRDPVSKVIDPVGLQAMVVEVERRVADVLATGRFPLVIGGDCPVLLGCLAAFGDPAERGLLFVDGHEDAYPPDRSTTGEAADMELGFATGIVGTPWWPALAERSPLVHPERTWLLGPRDRADIVRYGAEPLSDRVACDDAEAVAVDPIGVTEHALAAVSASPWWFHVDLDVLSTEALPAVDYPQPGGLRWEELDAITTVALAAQPIGWDVTIYTPDLDPDRTHAERIVRYLAEAVRSFRAAA